MKAFILFCIVSLALASNECGENERYKGCGTACPLTCDNYRNPPKICVAMCKIGCECVKGYVRAKDGTCVRPEDCPGKDEKCGENQHYNRCGTACPLTCENYRKPPKFCIKRCEIGCECDKGYVKTMDGRCVKPEDCPSQNQQSETDICNLPAEPGLCDAYMPRFFFDNSRGECRRFVYGGCGGNKNNFRSIEDCKETCENNDTELL